MSKGRLPSAQERQTRTGAYYHIPSRRMDYPDQDEAERGREEGSGDDKDESEGEVGESSNGGPVCFDWYVRLRLVDLKMLALAKGCRGIS
jgi:hypothetical protein